MAGCPSCGVGNLIEIASDENGAAVKCFNCGHGHSEPAGEPSAPQTVNRENKIPQGGADARHEGDELETARAPEPEPEPTIEGERAPADY